MLPFNKSSAEILGQFNPNAESGDYSSFLDKKLYKKDWYVLWGDIDADSCSLAGAFLLNAALEKRSMVTLFIMSGGGETDSSFALISLIEYAKSQGVIIRAYGAGLIGSAAFDIFSACSEGYRFAFETTMFMTHSSAFHVSDEDMYKLQKKFDKWTLQKYTNIHPTTIKKFLKTGNWWFDPQKALGYGVCDAVIKVGESLPEGPVYPKRKSAEQQQKEAYEDEDDD